MNLLIKYVCAYIEFVKHTFILGSFNKRKKINSSPSDRTLSVQIIKYSSLSLYLPLPLPLSLLHLDIANAVRLIDFILFHFRSERKKKYYRKNVQFTRTNDCVNAKYVTYLCIIMGESMHAIAIPFDWVTIATFHTLCAPIL